MDWARVWVRLTTILNVISDIGDTIILLIASRMVRDSNEIRQRAPSRIISKAFLVFDILLTLIYILTAGFVLANSKHEKPTMPLQCWIVVFMLYCIFHMFFSIIQHQGVPWLQAESTMFKNMEYKKNVFGILWWGLGMFFLVKGADDMHITAPKLTRILTFFLWFDIALAILCMLLLFTLLVIFCASILILSTFYYMRDQQNRRRRVQLPPCPWCHK